ncbi:GNAT family N-acetyltransferase [Promicromonospora sukumoe]|uniref:GNAT family N-acetyltransferase n=1 Tax=Promicromonospora sukumoe TaxID=88382 RepID=UPI0003759E72|nr:GNAT family N-acetyltransferase [Promicromonospora sukumoe]
MKDRTGAPVTVTLNTGRPIGAYAVQVDDSPVVGRADFVDGASGVSGGSAGDDDAAGGGDRVFFHTEVDEEYGGRGLAGILVREALADSIRKNIVVVPVCPLFAAHLAKHGDEYVAAGGAIRQPTRDDIAQVTEAVKAQRAAAREARRAGE